MHLVQQKLQGIDPPAVLSPDMIPPSLRTFTFPVRLVYLMHAYIHLCILFDVDLQNEHSCVRFWFKCCTTCPLYQQACSWHRFYLVRVHMCACVWFWFTSFETILRPFSGARHCRLFACRALFCCYILSTVDEWFNGHWRWRVGIKGSTPLPWGVRWWMKIGWGLWLELTLSLRVMSKTGHGRWSR